MDKPKPPLSRICEEGVLELCKKCGSTIKRKYNFLFFRFGKILGCIQPECENHCENIIFKAKKNYWIIVKREILEK